MKINRSIFLNISIWSSYLKLMFIRVFWRQVLKNRHTLFWGQTRQILRNSKDKNLGQVYALTKLQDLHSFLCVFDLWKALYNQLKINEEIWNFWKKLWADLQDNINGVVVTRFVSERIRSNYIIFHSQSCMVIKVFWPIF